MHRDLNVNSPTCSVSEDIRKHITSVGTWVPWKDNFWCYVFIVMKHHFYLNYEEIKIVFKQPVTD